MDSPIVRGVKKLFMSHTEDGPESKLDPVTNLTHHLFHLKLSIDTYPNEFGGDKGMVLRFNYFI